MAPRKVAKENSLEEEKPTRVLRRKLQVASENIIDTATEMKEKVDDKKKKTVKATEPKFKKKAAAPKEKSAPKPKKVAAKGHKLPDPIKPGEVFVDSAKKSWKVGKSLGSGGFGEVYSATDNLSDNKVDGYKYVMKVEYSTGPLFVEQHFYIRCAKAEHLEAWKKEHKLKAIGLPIFYAMKGQQEHNGNAYRFIIITKFGQDLEKLLQEHKKFNLKNTLTIGCSLVDTLEYIHHSGYVHADLKPANVLLGVDSSHAIVNIVDFGLATKYKDTDNNHKAHKVEKKSAHNGTLIYTSLVAHRGAVTTSRICDIEILAYNLLHLNTGSLPWAPFETQPDKVMQMKEELVNDPAKFLATHYKEPVPDVFITLFKYIASTKFEIAPDYDKLKQMFLKAIQKGGFKYDGKLNFDEKEKEPKAGSSAAKAEKPKRGKKAPPKIVEAQSDDEEPEEGEDAHIDEEQLRHVNTTKRRVKGKVEKVEDEADSDKHEEPKEKKKRKNTKEVKAAAPAIEVVPEEATPAPEPVHNLDETFNVPNPTPAMLDVLNKRQDKKAAPVKADRTSKDEKGETLTPAMQEIMDKRQEKKAAPVKADRASKDEKGETLTPAMQEIMDKRQEKKAAPVKADRASKDEKGEILTPAMQEIMDKRQEKKAAPVKADRASKDEKVTENGADKIQNPTPAMQAVMDKRQEKKASKDELNLVTKRKGKLNKVEEALEHEESEEDEPEPKDKRKKKVVKENKPEVTAPEPAVNETFVVPTPAMTEIMNKRNEKKLAPTRAKRT